MAKSAGSGSAELPRNHGTTDLKLHQDSSGALNTVTSVTDPNGNTYDPATAKFTLDNNGRIVPGSFADSSAQTMVPYSHILWASLWWGIAADAVAKAAEFVRGTARKNPGTVPPTATRLSAI